MEESGVVTLQVLRCAQDDKLLKRYREAMVLSMADWASGVMIL